MPLHTADALILRTYKLGEADRIVVFLTADRGKKRGVAKGARRTRSRFTGALEPLTQARVAYFERERRELVGLDYVEPIRSPLAARAEALGYVGYFSELIDEWAQEGDPSERLFRLGVAVLDALVRGSALEPLARYFEYWVLRLQGVYPPLVACGTCGRALLETGAVFVPRDRRFRCRECLPHGGTAVSAEALTFLRGAGRLGPSGLADLALSPRAARELEAAHRLIISTHLEKELRSVRVLKELRC